jgi:deoxyribose-phosphate aldolase
MSLQEQIAQTIDHALLHPTLGERELEKGIRKIAHLPLASVCVKPCHVKRTIDLIKYEAISPGTVIGFPHGSQTTAMKVAEAVEMATIGASELDMVVHAGDVLEGTWARVEKELLDVKQAVEGSSVVLKCIFETDYVDQRDAIERLTQLVEETGWDFAKTSTGFGFVKNKQGTYQYQGAQEQHLKWMRNGSQKIDLKASGGIRTLADWRKMTAAGASRIGTSSTLSILAEAEAESA